MNPSITRMMRHALLMLYLAVPMLATAQTYVNKEWSKTIGLPDTLNCPGTLEAVNPIGQVVWHRATEPGEKTLQIPVQAWADGVYCLRLSAGGRILATRILKY